MREILFRGKTYGGEWEYGVPVFTGLNNELAFMKQMYSYDHQVIPETVGQFIGLTDKNGAKIFEGDILRYYDDEIQVVEWSDEWSQIMLHTYGEHERKVGRKTVKEKFEGWNDLHDYPLEDMPILGNIHDNPELLEGDGAGA